MLERELKFHVPAKQRSRLKARLRKLGAEPIELHACYYDTATQALARAGIALRVRREGERWVQTIKLPGPDDVSRIEWNHSRPEAALDLSVYAGTHIEALISSLAGQLACRYVTHVIRLKKVIPTASGTAELAYDEGVIAAAGAALPVHELELEGVSGESIDLFGLSREWLNEYQLVLDLRSKAERGDALAMLNPGAGRPMDSANAAPALKRPRKATALRPGQVQRLAAAVRAGQAILPADAGIGTAYLACANDCMNQIIRNSGFLAGLDGMKTSQEQRIDYVHQIRVGIRRLRACWQLFGKTAGYPEPLLDALKHHFGILGQARDLDVIQTELLPRLIQAGMPPDTTQALPGDELNEPATRAELATSAEYQETLLDLLEHLVLYGDALATKTDLKKRAAPLLSKRLNSWLDRIRKQVPSFLEANWDDRHRMRKRVKRLRYGMEFAQGTLDTQRLAPLRNALVSAQKALGQLNDLYVAAEYYRGPGAKHPSAMFALGWLAATQGHEAHASQMALQTLAEAGRFSPAPEKARKPKRG